MDEESLFRSIRAHLLKQSRAGAEPDTEAGLADRFNVSRYHVRQALDVMTQMGIVTRTQKRGISFAEPGPDDISRQIESHLKIGNFDAYELNEARRLFDTGLISLAVRRLPPAQFGALSSIVTNMEGCIEFRRAALKFHSQFWETVFKGSGNRVLQVFATSLLLHTMNYLESRADELEDSWYSDMLTLDKQVLNALRAEDGERAQALVTEWLRKELML